jgi:hypothetical protein
MRALAPKGLFSPISPKMRPFSAACLAPDEWLKTAKNLSSKHKGHIFLHNNLGSLPFDHRPGTPFSRSL